MNEVKKTISILLSFIMLLSLFTVMPFTAGAVEADMVTTPATSGDYEYIVLKDGTAEIIGLNEGFVGIELEIPRELDGYTVTSIGYCAFEECTSLKSVTIPNSVTNIDDFAFVGCTGLENITIPDSVTSIGVGVFYITGYYNDTSNWENGVLYIGNYLIEADSETVSGEYIVKDGTKLIVERAFSNCESLTSVTIPESVASIGEVAFGGCTSLRSISVDTNNENYISIDGNLYNKDKTELLQYAVGKSDTEFIIPEGVTSIGEAAFLGCASLANITIPEGVTRIGNEAFVGCESLESITIPDGVTSIGEYAFISCGSLTRVTIPESVTSIGSGALFNTGYYNDETNWESGALYIDNFLIEADVETISGEYKVKDGTKLIADDAFYFCESLESVTIPDSVTRIGSGAFSDCPRLKSVIIPNSVTSIGDYALGYCFDLDLFEYVTTDGFTITGTTGSEAERYAKDNGFEFVSLGEAPTEKPTEAPITAVFGDVDGDGEVTVIDATEIQRYKAEIISAEELDLTVADVDKDGQVSVLDATRIQRYKAEICNLDGTMPYTG